MKRFILLMWFLAFFITLVILKFFDNPWIWISFLWFVTWLIFSIRIQKRLFRIVGVNITLLCLFTALLEILFLNLISQQTGLRHSKVTPNGYYKYDKELGYAPRKNFSANWKEYYGPELLYDVQYTIDSIGLRISPSAVNSQRGALIFFGGSFTFGAGVHDWETFPFRVGKQLDGAYSVYNFGFHGYGPHQMLRAFECGYVTEKVKERVKCVIYLALSDHVRRSAGLTSWDKYGPRYIIDSGGNLIFTGPFTNVQSDRSGYIRALLWNQFKKSNLVKWLGGHYRPVNHKDILTTVSIVEKAFNWTKRLFPESEFHVILWDYNDKQSVVLGLEFQKKSIPIHLITKILPELAIHPEKYKIHTHDAHLSAKAHKYIADYIVRRILRIESLQ